MKRNIKILSLLMAVLLAFSIFPFSTAYAVEGTETVETRQTEEFALPDIVPEEEAVGRGYIGRVKEEEKDNYTFVFKDSENMRTMRVYSHPVKYTDKDGNTKDITLDIQSRPGGGFETKDNSIKTTFGAKLSDGIRLQSEDVDVKLIPANSLNQATLSEDNKTVSYTLDEKTTLEYSLTYTGFKEDIVVNEYTGQTEYEFLLYTNGLTVKEEMGSYYLADVQGNRKANIGDIIIFTADERNNTLGELSCIEIKENQIYGLTIHVDAEYLKDEKTVYPIRIDPTLEVTGTGAIEDVTVYTGTSYYSGALGILYVGTADGMAYRALMRFPNLNISHLHEDYIAIATIELRDVMCQGIQVPLQCHRYTALPGMWYESGTTTWNSVGGDAYVGELLDEQTVYYGNGNVAGISQRYSFNITSLAKKWAENTLHPGMGVIFKTSDAFEDAAPTNTEDRLKYFGSYNRSDYQPSLTIIYSNPFSASKSHVQYYDSSSDLKNRANCYGFALKMFYAPENYPSYWGNCYKQQPGEFYDKTGSTTLSNYDYTFSMILPCSVQSVLNAVVLDLQQLGYSVLSSAKYDDASEIPNATEYADRRLILLVVGSADYHFYMQNGDNTWSHKPGSSNARYTCRGLCGNETELTNNNILSHMTEGGYTNDYIFFYVDKPVTLDYAHQNGTHETCKKTSTYLFDVAASSEDAFKPINGSSISGRIDYPGDQDWFGLVILEERTVTVNITTISGSGTPDPYTLKVFLKNPSGVYVLEKTITTGSGSFTFTTTGDHQVYRLLIRSEGQTSYEVVRRYSVTIS